MDLKIKNDTEVPVRISAHALGQTVSIEVYGQPLPEGESVDATAKIVDRYDEATDVTLYKSTLDRAGAAYKPLHTVRLGTIAAERS